MSAAHPPYIGSVRAGPALSARAGLLYASPVLNEGVGERVCMSQDHVGDRATCSPLSRCAQTVAGIPSYASKVRYDRAAPLEAWETTLALHGKGTKPFDGPLPWWKETAQKPQLRRSLLYCDPLLEKRHKHDRVVGLTVQDHTSPFQPRRTILHVVGHIFECRPLRGPSIDDYRQILAA